MENLDKLVNELRKLPTETQWLEFKHNNYTPDMIGKDIKRPCQQCFSLRKELRLYALGN